MTLADAVALLLWSALTIYVVLAGADFGGGILDLFARGPRAADQRRLIEEAMAPVWEANHVWVIFAVVVLFTAFPPAFAAVSVALHVPLTLMLVGIVLRGSAFVFRQYGYLDEMAEKRWGRVFAASSVLTPLCLGAVIGVLSSGALPPVERMTGMDFLVGWVRPFPLAVGALAVALFALLAAVYLTNETEDLELREHFRGRAFVAAAALVAAQLLCGFALEEAHLPFRARFAGHTAAGIIEMLGAGALVALLAALAMRRYRTARAAAIALAVLILAGWGYAQYPFLVAPTWTIGAAAAPPETLRIVLAVSALGSLILVPSLYYMLRVFKGEAGGKRRPPEVSGSGPRS